MGRILIVDDEEDILDSMQTLLNSLGHDVRCVSDPDDALVAAAQDPPDLILHDLRMPGLSLAGMVASLRSHPATADIPLVFFSAHPDLPRTAAKYDAWGYLRKPFVEQELVNLLDAAMAGRLADHERGKEPRRAVQDMFHDFWNTLSAMAITTRTLTKSADVKGDDRRSAEALNDLLLKLESQTDKMRATMMAVLDEADEEPRRHRRPAPTRHHPSR